MANTIRVAINGYGNLGRGVEAAIKHNSDMELVGVFTRRDPASISTDGSPVHRLDELAGFAGQIDVVLCCGGSATDLQQQVPEVAQLFNTVDTFDNHARIPEYFAAVDEEARASGHLSMISSGWDPGLFSLNRLLFEAVLPQGKTTTFWGRGVSQGHGDAIRRVKGVKDAKQYTVPVPEALDSAMSGERRELTSRESHVRECFVVAEEGADLEQIRHDIVTMPNYFEPYDTTVTFITAEELERDHAGMPHGGTVIRSGDTTPQNLQVVSFQLALDSHPEFTGSVAVASARAVARMAREGSTGAISILDVPPAYLSARSGAELRKALL